MEMAPTTELRADLSVTALAWMLWINILHKKTSKQEAKPKYYVLMYFSGQR